MPPSPWLSIGLALSLAGSALCAGPNLEAKPVPLLLDYHCAGLPLTEYQDLRVTVRTDGVAVVVVKRRTATSVLEVDRGTLYLDGSNLVELRHHIRQSGFFEEPDRDSEARLHSSEQTLSAGLDGKQRTLKFRYRSRLQPLATYLWQFIHQVELIGKLQRGRDTAGVRSTLSPHTTGPKVLQPRALRKPLEQFILASNNQSQLCDAFEALAHTLSAREWVEFSRAEAGRGGTRRLQVLAAVSSWPLLGNIPRDHVAMLEPLLKELSLSNLQPKEQHAIQEGLILIRSALAERREAR